MQSKPLDNFRNQEHKLEGKSNAKRPLEFLCSFVWMHSLLSALGHVANMIRHRKKRDCDESLSWDWGWTLLPCGISALWTLWWKWMKGTLREVICKGITKNIPSLLSSPLPCQNSLPFDQNKEAKRKLASLGNGCVSFCSATPPLTTHSSTPTGPGVCLTVQQGNTSMLLFFWI